MSLRANEVSEAISSLEQGIASLQKSRLAMTCCILLILFSSCAPRPTDCARPDVFCVGLVTASGSIQDGINQQAWLGLQDAKAEGLADRIDTIETVDSRDRAANIQAFVSNGYDVIITVGSSISDETIATAQKNPKIKFIGVEQNQDTSLPNLTGLVFHEEQSGFLAGALAASITQTNRVAGICEAKFIDAMRRYCDGFKAGAQYINPNVNADIVYRTGSNQNLFNDPDWGTQTALQAVHDGADVVFAAGGNTANAALEAAAAQDAYVIGSETDRYESLTDVRSRLVSSAVNDVRTGIRDLMRLAHNNSLPAGNFFGPIELAPFHDLDDHIPPSVKNLLNQLAQGLATHSVNNEV
ncbi:MAG TPA: BMP family ABC transporter substrate-binding protein, partial [Anaerolineales bacterium]